MTKKIALKQTDILAAKATGKSVEQVAKEKTKRGPYKKRKPKVDWEKLAKRLQAALASEIKEHDATQKSVDSHIEMVAHLIKVNIGKDAIIKYLEDKDSDGNN